MIRHFRLTAALLLCGAPVIASAQRIATPREALGADLGSDYFLANYQQLSAYWRTLDRQSNRMALHTIGTTSEGRPMLMAVITAPENHRRLARYQEIARRLALAEGLDDAQARALASEGKAVVWIDGGLHASEVLGAQQLMELVYELVSRNDAETLRFLRDVIVLAVHANPDGHDLVADWYMRRANPVERSTDRVPRLYHKYIGHDNNRDFFLASQRESQAMDSVMYRAWFPQIMYNHHQTAPEGTIMFAPPFRDPFNYNIDPLIITMLDQVGGAMHSRMIAEGKPGTVMTTGAGFSTWWNGGLRTTAYFHNIVGLLTETFGHPTPRRVEWRPARLQPSGALPFPILPQLWHFRQSMDYSRTANRAVLDFASRHREELLFNIYRAGRNSIERGSRDHWTLTPSLVAPVRAAWVRDSIADAQRRRARAARDGTPQGAAMERDTDSATVVRADQPRTPTDYRALLHDPAKRDARAYVIPADQPDFLTAVKFVNALIKNGVRVHRATAPFTLSASGARARAYPAGSFVVFAAQAFRPHVRDMFEPQDHPNDFEYPGGPPIPPYDNAGYTLAFQMGVDFDRILDGFTCPCDAVSGFASHPRGVVNGNGPYYLAHETNDAFVAINRLLAAGLPVWWMREGAGTQNGRRGVFYIPGGDRTGAVVRELAEQRGLNFDAGPTVRCEPPACIRLEPRRVALWDIYGGSMPSGWTRWILEQFEFPFSLVFPPEIDAGGLRAKYDVIILPDGAHTVERDSRPDRMRESATAPADAPAEWRARSGVLTQARSVPQLRRFLEEGGTILAIGSATDIAYQLGVPIEDALRTDAGERLPRSQYYVPGSVLRMRVNSAHPLAHGVPEHVDVFFDNSPAFRVGAAARDAGARAVGWFDTDRPLRSGWAWGQERLREAAQIVEIPVGRGTLVLYAPEVLFRAQPHGTFKLLFNGIHYGGAAQWR